MAAAPPPPPPVPPYESVCALAQTYLGGGPASALCSRLENAKAAAERGNTEAKAGMIRAFINQVEALAGKRLTWEQANDLVTLAGRL